MSKTPINICQGQFNNGKAKMHPQVDNGIQFRPNGLNKIKDYFMVNKFVIKFQCSFILTRLCLSYQHEVLVFLLLHLIPLISTCCC